MHALAARTQFDGLAETTPGLVYVVTIPASGVAGSSSESSER